MLSKINRLREQKDFESVFKTGRYLRGVFLSGKAAKNNLPRSRFGIVVSAKVSKKAVIRNKIKRRLRHIIYRRLPEIKEGFDIAIIAAPAAAEKTFGETVSEFNDLLEKGKLLK